MPPAALQATRERVVRNKWNIAAYSALLIFVAGLLIEHGEVRASNRIEIQYCEATVGELNDRANKYEAKYEACRDGD